MSSSAVLTSIRRLRSLLAGQQGQEQSDEQLLAAFAERHDDSAFAALVRRHGPMVLGVCRRLLGHEQDAEDAFQSTFLVLARSAATLRDKSALGSFLHGAAYRLASKIKRAAGRRRKHEGQAPPRQPTDPAEELSWREIRALLDEEIARLSEKYRSAFVLCCLEHVSREEAAWRLGVKEGTLSSRLAEARKLLQKRLAHRGVELTAVLAAIALAAPPARLMAATIATARVARAGGELADVVSASVAALVENSSPVLNFGKAKLAVLILTVSLLASGAALAPREKANPRGSNAAPLTQPAAAPAAESAAYAGRVLDPDGKPVAGAKIYLIYHTAKEQPVPVRTISDKNGRFHFAIAKKDFDTSHSARPWDLAWIVAMAEGYGFGTPASRDKPSNLCIRLAKDDVPITGRILDLQGKPITGVAVGVHELFWPRQGDLTEWLRDLKETKEGYRAMSRHLRVMKDLRGLHLGLSKIFPRTVTDVDGRFCLRGVGRERVAALRLEGAGIAVIERFALTRPSDIVRSVRWDWRGSFDDEMIFCGPDCVHIAAPCQPIVGVIRDRDTGKPIPGAVVRSYVFAGPGMLMRPSGEPYLHAVADKDGRYRLNGMPKAQGNVIRAEGPDDQPYLMALAQVPRGFALDPVTVDIQLKRGVWIEGTVTEKVTGKPVHSEIHCAVFPDNPFLKDAPGLMFDHHLWTHPVNGTFRFAGLPGRGVITARASTSMMLRMQQTNDPKGRSVVRELTLAKPLVFGVGADRIKGLNSLRLQQGYHTIVEINPTKDAKTVRCAVKCAIPKVGR